ncbi:MAG: nicotinate-nucleotide adenylyltransferase [Natronohydrobacter sp.]|nr:nicotinate-nucleotide adenylyltransferase [Natronohydrobacter sp.]
MRHALPYAPKGARIGLFGGSFDPAHEGHVHVTHHALRRLRLDQVWWLVTPGNPLKAHGPAPLDARLARARSLMRDPRVQITQVESLLGTRYSADTLAAIKRLYRDRHFVWIMGADNLAGFHRWENWRSIMALMPVAVFARPGQQRAALGSVAARRFAAAQRPETQAGRLTTLPPPAWSFLRLPMRNISSTHLRARGDWGGM